MRREQRPLWRRGDGLPPLATSHTLDSHSPQISFPSLAAGGLGLGQALAPSTQKPFRAGIKAACVAPGGERFPVPSPRHRHICQVVWAGRRSNGACVGT